MKSRSACLLGTLLSVVLSAIPSLPAQAANINTTALACQQYLFPESGRTDELVRSFNYITTNSDTEHTVSIVCDVTRSPLIAGATSGGFYMDGDNLNVGGNVWFTACTLNSYDYTGVLLGSVGFQSQAPSYDVYISLPAAQLPTYAYTSLFCVLPPHGIGRIRGITSLQ